MKAVVMQRKGGPEVMQEMDWPIFAQKDGSLATTLAAGSAPGESGVSVLSLRFQGGAHWSVTSPRHCIFLQMSQQLFFDCRFAGRAIQHQMPPGRLSIVPAGMDIAVDTEESLDAVFVKIDPGQLALAAAEYSGIEAQLIERFVGYDQALLDHARILAAEAAAHYPNGPLFWNEVARGFIDGLLTRHTSGFDGRARGRLGKDVLKRLKDYILAHLDESVEVATLAKIAGRSPFHFSRVFTRSVGVTPHRYIVHLRLERAVELIRDGEFGLVDIALRTGFADQNHLCRWVRRVHGVTLSQLPLDT